MAGAAIITAGILVHLLTGGEAGLLGGVVLGMAGAATTAWLLARAVRDGWRRAVTAALAVFAGLMLAFPTAPLNIWAGRTGLVSYLIVLAALALILGRRAGRAARARLL